MVDKQFNDDMLGLSASGLMPARSATKTPNASKYDFTRKALIPSASGGTFIRVTLSVTAIIFARD